MSKHSLLNFLYDNIQKDCNAPLLITHDQSISWKNFVKQTRKISGWLLANKVEPGSRIACFIDDHLTFFQIMFGVWGAGGIVAPINMSLLSSQRQSIINKLQPHILLSTSKELIDVEQINSNTLVLPEILDDYSDNNDLYFANPNDSAMIIFTSGSTGVPKGVVSTHFALSANCRLTSEQLKLSSKDRLFINTPAYYTSAICHYLTSLYSSASIFCHSGFLFYSTFSDLIKKYKCTGFGGAPAHITRFFSNQDIQLPEHFRFIMSSGDYLSADLTKKLLYNYNQIELFNVYGLSEVSGRLCFLKPEDQENKIGSVGKPFPCMDIKILNENLQGCEPESSGEVYVKGPLLTKEYFNDLENTKKFHTDYGFSTGDIGYFDRDGFLFLQGRNDDIFKSGGEKISTIAIQEAIESLNIFDDVAVLPINDDILGKVSAVYYVKSDFNDANIKTITKTLRDKLPPNYIPQKYICVNEIPRTGSGKVNKNDL